MTENVILVKIILFTYVAISLLRYELSRKKNQLYIFAGELEIDI